MWLKGLTGAQALSPHFVRLFGKVSAAGEMMSVFALPVISMEDKMIKIRGLLDKRSLLWTVVLIIVFLTVVTVYAIMPAFGLI